jgi:hypothetical protein
MPQLPDRFSAYPVTTRLDANGDGSIRFQATGSNIVITNLYVAVATQVLQAKCTIYKGQVGPQWAINTTNSGSTGSSANGRIELLDGEAIYVVWDGGDANTIATATFTGMVLPFNVRPETGTEFVFAEPFAAGDGTIIFPALKSPNYVPGVSGWIITREGDVEFGEGTFRGDLLVQGASGKYVKISPNEPFKGIEFNSGNVNLFANGAITVFNSGLQMFPPDTNGFGLVPVMTFAQQAGGSTQGLLEIDEADVTIKSTGGLFTPKLTVPFIETTRRVDGVSTNTASAAIGATETVVLTTAGATFLGGRSYKCVFSGLYVSSVANTDVTFRIRKDNGTTAPPTGQALNSTRYPARGAGVAYDATWVCYFACNSDVTAQLVFSITGSAGNNGSFFAGGSNPVDLSIYDDGPASDHAASVILT